MRRRAPRTGAAQGEKSRPGSQLHKSSPIHAAVIPYVGVAFGMDTARMRCQIARK
jgi:hypothetical protein